MHRSTVSNINCPQKVIKFYEERVRFRNEPTDTEKVVSALTEDSSSTLEPMQIPESVLNYY